MAKTVNQLVQESDGDEQALYILLASSGMRISEALAIERRNFTNDGCTIQVRQQVHREKPLIVSYLKTDAVYREIDLHPEVAEYLRVFICGKDGLLFKTRNGTPHLHNNIEERWLTERLKAMQLDERGMGWHAFRRFRTHGCEGGDARRTSRISGLAISLGPCPSCIRTCSRKRSFDLRKSAQVGVGFDIPAYIAPNCSKGSVRSDVQVSM